MAQAADSVLLTAADVIKNETTALANSANRVGTMLDNIIDSKINNDKIAISTALGTSDALVPSQKAVKAYVDNFAGGSLATVKVSLSSAQILALNTTPVTLVAAPGAGKIIQPIAVMFNLVYNTTTYATNILAQIRYAGISANFITSTILGLTASTLARLLASTSLTFAAVPSNTALILDTQTGNPTTGNSTMDVYLTYTVITL